MNTYYDSPTGRYGQQDALAQRVSLIMKRVYFKMFLAMIVSGLTAWYMASSVAVMTFFANHTWMSWVIFGAELILVMSISGGINRMSFGTATLLFYLFAIVNGAMLFPIIYAYSGVSIATLMDTFNRAYRPDSLKHNPLVSPLKMTDETIARLPRTLMISAERDILLDQGKAFASRLKANGVAADHRIFPSTVHLFITVPGQPAAFDEAVRLTVAHLSQAGKSGKDGGF